MKALQENDFQKAQLIDISLVVPNTGQIDGLPKNPRFIRDEKFEALKRSILEDPEMLTLRPVMVYPFNGNYVAIGGNMRLTAMRELGYSTVPCVVIPEGTTADKLRAYTMKDNYGYGEWDASILAEYWDLSELDNWDMSDLVDFEDEGSDAVLNEEKKETPMENPYTTITTSPIYEIKGECPELCSIFDSSKTEELLVRVEESNVPEDVKVFLRLAAMRHTVINYSLVAEYYAHAPKEVQELFEDSALVIIDFNKAIENGYSKLRSDLNDIYEKNKALIEATYDEE